MSSGKAKVTDRRYGVSGTGSGELLHQESRLAPRSQDCILESESLSRKVKVAWGAAPLAFWCSTLAGRPLWLWTVGLSYPAL